MNNASCGRGLMRATLIFVLCPLLFAATVSLCSAGEQIVFSCTTMTKKVVSLCSSTPLTEAAGYLQYRFGTAGRAPELSYPTTREHPRNLFLSGTMMYSGGGGAYLKFTNDGFGTT